MRNPDNESRSERSSGASPDVARGTITFICGCMFSGKTTLLFRRLRQFAPASVLVLKHEIDRRYQADAVVSHAGQAWPAAAIRSADQLPDKIRPGVEIVAVDEAHFFGATIVNVAEELRDRGLHVILTSLDLDSWGRPFPVAERLLAVADEPIVKHAVCARCGRRADHTQRLTPIIDGNMVGGPESYEPRCLKCWVPPPEPPPR